jgi:23S rRNA (pseudouridine1915-N3)-methyltransferase
LDKSLKILEIWLSGGNAAGRIFCGILLFMQVTLAHIGARPGSKDCYDTLIKSYLKRIAAFVRCDTEAFRSEKALLEWLGRQKGRTAMAALFLDERGRQMTSEAMAEWLGKRRDEGTQHVVFAIGPADGWSDEARAEGERRGGLLSLSTMTLAHQLARLVMAEQLYRACTILTGHPYHRG